MSKDCIIRAGRQSCCNVQQQQCRGGRIIVMLDPNTDFGPNTLPMVLSYIASYTGTPTLPYHVGFSVSDFNQMYCEGYRIFIINGISTDSKVILTSWFPLYPDVTVIDIASTSSDPIFTNRVPGRWYRMVPDDTYQVTALVQLVQSVSGINTIYVLQEARDDYSKYFTTAMMAALTAAGYSPTLLVANSLSDITGFIPQITASNHVMTINGLASNSYDATLVAKLAGTQFGYFAKYQQLTISIDISLAGRYYILVYSGVHERNVRTMLFSFSPSGVIPCIIDAVSLAYKVEYNRDNALDISWCPGATLVGSQGYLYFNHVGDRVFSNFTAYLMNNQYQWYPEQIFEQIGSSVIQLLRDPTFQMIMPITTQMTHIPAISICGNTCLIINPNTPYGQQVQATAAYMGLNYPTFNLTSPYSASATQCLLDSLYCQGYRAFVGFGDSDMLISAYNWFQDHHDAYAVSLYSDASGSYASDIDKRGISNMYRMTPPSYITYDYYLDFAKFQGTTNMVYLLGEQGHSYSESIVNGLSATFTKAGINNTIVYISPSTNLVSTLAGINSSASNLAVVVLPTQVSRLYQVLSTSGTVATFLETGTTLSLRPTVPSSLTNYYYIVFNPPYERNISQLYTTLGNQASLPLYDALVILQNNNIKEIGSYGYLYFNRYGDRSVYTYTIFKSTSGIWKSYMTYNMINNIFFSCCSSG